MTEESIVKLLRSKIREDRLLGIEYAVSQLGQEWCKENFTAEKNFQTHSRRKGKIICINKSTEDWGVIEGFLFIQYRGAELWNNQGFKIHTI